ncbi:MAG: hypothetical protein HQL41_10680 [Alphaproteobacteria bacterium]|nr:hypothetical protein [Alphaproteobacteria bacterium]
MNTTTQPEQNPDAAEAKPVAVSLLDALADPNGKDSFHRPKKPREPYSPGPLVTLRVLGALVVNLSF